MQESRPLFNRIYQAEPGRGHYHDQLNTWCSRIKIRNIAFQTEQTEHFTDDGKRLFRAIPIFPRIYQEPQTLGGAYAGRGLSRLDAQEASLRTLERAQLGIDLTLVRWYFSTENGYQKAMPYLYGGPSILQDPNVFGWGTSKRGAEEEASRALLLSNRYCVTW